MTLSLPLTVRLKTGRADVHVESQTRELSFSSSIPGGFGSCNIRLDRPLTLDPNDIALYASVFVYDARNGSVVWEGRLEDPGRGISEDGQIWSISAVGPRAHASDRNFPIIYVDSSLESWHRSKYSVHGAHTDMGELDQDVPSLDVYATEGTSVTTAWLGDWIYRGMYFTGQKVARVRADHIEETANTNLHVAVFARTGNGSATWGKTWNWVTTSGVIGGQAGDVDDTTNVWDNTIDVVSLRAQRDNTNLTAGTNVMAHFSGPAVRCYLKNADGTDITAASSYLVNNVDPVEVIADLLGRYLTKYDGANAILIGSGVDIDQLAYPDGITADQIFSDLSIYDPGFYWAAWESNALGKYRFEYIPWPSTVRYEATAIDGFDSPGSASELFNAVTVRWKDSRGLIRTTRRTQTVTELNLAGITREEYIDLSDEMGSLSNATHAGDNFLAEHKYPPNAGSLKISRPILDQNTGRMVKPWEIRPGHLVRVRGINPRVDSLNPTSRDGVTIFKVVAVTFDSSDVSATLELDTHSRTVARALANLKARRLRKR